MKYAMTALLTTAFASAGAMAQTEPAKEVVPSLDVTVSGFKNGGTIPTKFAYCKPDGNAQTRNSDNISPKISWTNVPEGTKSFALVMVDKDVPADFRNANKQGQTIEDKAPRQNFYHWAVINIPAGLRSIPEGKASNGVVPGGKQTGNTEFGTVGRNDFSKMGDGPNGNYDGPCPPWNDLRLHHYYFNVYALDVPSLSNFIGFRVGIDGRAVEAAIMGHVLAKGEYMGTYSNNFDVLGGK